MPDNNQGSTAGFGGLFGGLIPFPSGSGFNLPLLKPGQFPRLEGEVNQMRRIPPGLRGLTGPDPISGQAFTSLMEILQSQGATDPRRLNRQITSIGRGTEAQQTGARESLAQLGPGALQSGLGQALMASIGQAGEDRTAQAMSDEAQLQEARKRQDLDLFMRLVLAPLVEQQALNASLDQAGQSRSDALLGTLLGVGGSLLGAPGSSILGGLFK